MIGIIKRNFSCADKDTFIQLYKAFIRPHLEYANAIWCPCKKRQWIAVEKVQRRATKIFKGCKNIKYAYRLNYLNLYSMKGRRIRGDLIQTFKIFNNIDDVPVNSIFTTNNNNTRNSEGKVFIKHSSSKIRKHYFSNRVAHIWNLLTPDTKFTDTINKFKNSLDRNPKLVELFKQFDE